jgi:hypothetical protein
MYVGLGKHGGIHGYTWNFGTLYFKILKFIEKNNKVKGFSSTSCSPHPIVSQNGYRKL